MVTENGPFWGFVSPQSDQAALICPKAVTGLLGVMSLGLV